MILVVLFVLALALYLAPAFVAFGRGAPSPAAILAINIMFGWTVVGWALALVLALRSPQPSCSIQVINCAPGPAPSWRDPVAVGAADPPGRLGSPPPLPAADPGWQPSPLKDGDSLEWARRWSS